MYVIINKFLVKQRSRQPFLAETRNIWIRNYKKSRGLLETLIMQERQNPEIFLTVDMWKTKK